MIDAAILPEGWKSVRLAEIGDFKSGSGFPLAVQGKEAGDYPFFKVSDFSNVGNEQALTRANHYISEAVRKRIGARVFPRGTIAFAKIGAAIFLERKRVTAQESCLDNNMAGFILSDTSYSLQLILLHFRDFALGDLVSSTALPAISSADLKGIYFALPEDTDEQKAIAQTLGDIDDLIASLGALIVKKRDIKQGAMQQLLTGERRLPGFSGEWGKSRLQELCSFITKGATPTTYGFGWQDSGVLFLRSECVSEHGLDLEQSKFISEKAAHFFRRGEVAGGDVLITITGNVGRVVFLTKSFGAAIMNQHIARIRVLPEKACAAFIYHYLSQREARDYLVSIVTGQAYPQISLKQVRDMEVLLPSYDEQSAIADTLSDMGSDILIAEDKLRKLNEIRQGMMQQLLTGSVRLV